MKTIVCVPLLLAVTVSSPGQSQTFAVAASVIDPQPGGIAYEKAIDYFTATNYPSYFLGTDVGAFLYDTVKHLKITVSYTGKHYVRAKPFHFPGDAYPGLIASVDNTLVWYQNPANANGGDATRPWGKFVINSHSGCHDLYIADLDGDGKEDVACSGTALLGDASFVTFQNGRNDWTAPRVNAAPVGDGIALVAVNGVNGGARTNIVGCSNNNLYWYQNPGGPAARTATWQPHFIGSCNAGVSLATLNVGNRDIVVVASNEAEPTAWVPGLVYYDPGTNPYAQWAQHTIDGTYLDVHQITGSTLGGIPFIIVAEQEQASYVCNSKWYNDHPAINGCRVTIFPWTGTGFGTPTLVANLGTQNQQVLAVGDMVWMVGANHDYYAAVDPAYYLWQISAVGSSVPTGPGGISPPSAPGGGGFWHAPYKSPFSGQ